MAMIGMRHIVAAPLYSHSDGAEPTYTTGEGFDVGGAISADLTKNRNTAGDLYYDDALGESDQGLISLALALGVDELTEDVLNKLGLMKKVTSTSTPAIVTYYETSENPIPVGLGYMRVRQKKNVTTYQGIWIYKMQFTMDSEQAQTKGESIQWQTPTVNGKGFGLDIDGSGDLTFRKIRTFESASDCATWLDGLAGISRI